MDFKTLTPGKIQIGVLPDINRVGKNPKTCNIPTNSAAARPDIKIKKDNSLKSNVFYLFGVTSAILEVTTGILLITGATKKGQNLKLTKLTEPLNNLMNFAQKKIPQNGIKKSLQKWKDEKPPIKKLSDACLALAATFAIPTEWGAAIKSQQPGMLLSSAIWATSIPLIFFDLGTRTKGLYSLAYAPSFASFANDIHNEFCLKDGANPRKKEVDFKKPLSLIKFSLEDQIVAAKTAFNTVTTSFKQGLEYLSGKREKRPDILSIKPSKESMSLASTLLILGSLPKIILGKKRLPDGSLKLRAVETTIGLGMVFDTLGMMSLANTKNDSRRPALLVGGLMRISGDFFQENPIAYGIRTIGGASCMYYWAGINKEQRENGSAAEPHKEQ